jgi:hypothetical protein
MNIYSGMGHIAIPSNGSVHNVYTTPKYPQKPVHRVSAVNRRETPVQPESSVGKTARARMVEKSYSRINVTSGGYLQSSNVQMVSQEKVGSFFDSYA